MRQRYYAAVGLFVSCGVAILTVALWPELPDGVPTVAGLAAAGLVLAVRELRTPYR